MVVGMSFVSVAVTNTGNANLKPAGEFVLSDANGVEGDRRQVTMDSVYAGNATSLELPFNHLLSAGDYTASLTMTNPVTHATAHVEQAMFTVPVLIAPLVVPSTDAAGPAVAPVAQPVSSASNGLSLTLVLGMIAASLLLGVGLTFGMTRMRAGHRQATSSPAAPLAPGALSVPSPSAPLNGTPSNMAPRELLTTDTPVAATRRRL
jgi:hypothetical protein